MPTNEIILDTKLVGSITGDLYLMKPVIEEGFILDALQNYMH